MQDVIFLKLFTGQETKEQICTKIAQIDVFLESLYTTATTSISNGSVAEYELDTGQSKQKVKYTTMESVLKTIEGYEKLRQMLANKLISRTFRVMDSQNFPRR